ncbi:hypothetical protein Ade02nite_42330 [Paractinoplanes deccanensis]|uniref:Uncharacterized protein n=1 Tax=Paractinoplanes deccanensis TaxID=113561 RepID=A0ABQ3Y6I5_9ACTN|nr:hypothetical protein [Actinoplanes deccanensis]GID75592.1 hypothetical protein Ade02nite_42330 [Actinoplanes deccanensis]
MADPVRDLLLAELRKAATAALAGGATPADLTAGLSDRLRRLDRLRAAADARADAERRGG